MTDRNTPTNAKSQRPIRRFTDSAGVHWEVHEELGTALDRRGGSSLIFHSEEIGRRIRNYPSNWFDLSAEELEAISKRT